VNVACTSFADTAWLSSYVPSPVKSIDTVESVTPLLWAVTENSIGSSTPAPSGLVAMSTAVTAGASTTSSEL